MFANDGAKWIIQVTMAVLEFSKEEDEAWYMSVSGHFEEKVRDSLSMIADRTARTLLFHSGGSLCLKFLTQSGFDETNRIFDNCLFENKYQMEATEANKIKVIDKTAYGAWVEGQDDGESFWDAPEQLEPAQSRQSSSHDKFGGGVTERKSNHHALASAQQLEMGGLDSSFVLRSNTMEVFRNRQDGLEDTKLSFSLQHGGVNLTPSKALLARQERDMLLLTPEPGKKSSVFQMDIERGQVTSEWKFVKDGVEVPMMDISADTKKSQMEPCQTFMGLDGNRLCQWDTRTARGMVHQMNSPVALSYSSGHDFSRNTNFRCMATTGTGQVVVGSEDGKIRLYGHTANQELTLSRARTSFPGLGTPITHVDTTYSGEFVLATTDSYIIVISTVFKKNNGEFTTGFKTSMAKHFHAPRLLRLLPEDVTKTGGAKLSKARFTWVTEQGQQERLIVASVGKFSVLWNFRRVKQLVTSATSNGMKVCTDYHLSAGKDENIVESAFMHERFNTNCNQLVVATEHDVFSMANMNIDD